MDLAGEDFITGGLVVMDFGFGVERSSGWRFGRSGGKNVSAQVSGSSVNHCSMVGNSDGWISFSKRLETKMPSFMGSIIDNLMVPVGVG